MVASLLDRGRPTTHSWRPRRWAAGRVRCGISAPCDLCLALGLGSLLLSSRCQGSGGCFLSKPQPQPQSWPALRCPERPQTPGFRDRVAFGAGRQDRQPGAVRRGGGSVRAQLWCQRINSEGPSSRGGGAGSRDTGRIPRPAGPWPEKPLGGRGQWCCLARGSGCPDWPRRGPGPGGRWSAGAKGTSPPPR